MFATLVALTATAADPTLQPVEINTVGNPRGYHEYLPAAYHENPTEEFAVLIALHGLGKVGDGLLAAPGQSVNGKLQEVLQNGPISIVNNPSHALHDFFDQENVIILAPQYVDWWNHGAIREFLDFALSYYRIDERRIYMVGQSAGSTGIHSFMNNDPFADQVAGFVPTGIRGKVLAGAGDYLGKRVSYWGQTAVDAGGGEADLVRTSVNNLAGFLLGTGPTDVKANYPGKFAVHTATFDLQTGSWVWETGVNVNADSNIKLTLFTGSSHNSWDRAYNNIETWNWLFGQIKPDIAITSPSENHLSTTGNTVNFQATVTDLNGTPITGSAIQWESNIDGILGSGESLALSSLSVGVHKVTCSATDSSNRINRSTVTVSIVYGGAFTAQIDIGASSYLSGSPNWNDLTDYRVGFSGSVIENAVSDTGVPTGMRVEVSDGFLGINSGGVQDSSLYPVNVQRDTVYVGNAAPHGELLISGLNPSQGYDFTIFASRSASGSRISQYTVNGQVATLEAINNTSNVAVINNVMPNALGQVTLELDAVNHQYAYLGAMIIESDGSGSGGPSNASPVAVAGSDLNLVLPLGGTVSATLAGSVSDDGLPSGSLTSLWSVTSSPPGSNPVFVDASLVDTSVTFDLVGNYTLELTADDGELTGSSSLNVTVSSAPVNAAPVVVAGSDLNLDLPAGSNVSAVLSGAVSDDGLPSGSLTSLWTVTDSPAGSAPTFTDANAVDSTITFDVAGSYTLELTADDGELTGSDSLTVTVTEVNAGGSGSPIFSQDFTASSVVADYVTTPAVSDDEFDDISVDANGGTWSINNGALEHERVSANGGNGGATFQRFSGLPSVTFARVEFELAVTGTTTYSEIGNLTLGDWQNMVANTSGGASATKAFALSVKARGADNYYLRLNGVSAADIPTDGSLIQVVWYANMTGSTQTYDGADGSVHSVDDGNSDLWIDGQLVLDDITRNSNYEASAISAFRFRTASSQPVTLVFDDLNIFDQSAVVSDTLLETLTSEGLNGHDIGAGSAGSSRILLSGEWEVTGSGSGLSGTSDSFHYEETGVEGDFALYARVKDLTSSGSSPRAGIMIRESNNADARMVALATTLATNYAVIDRTIVGGSANEVITTESYAYPDAWLMLERIGDIINVAVSSDGQSYSQIDSVTLTGLGAVVQAGLFASSGDIGTIADATIEDFELTVSPALFTQDFNSSTTIVDYFDAVSPSANQLSDIGAEVNGGTWSINNGALQLVRAGLSGADAGAGFMRYEDFAGSPNVLKIEFDLAVSNTTTYSDMASMRIGNYGGIWDYSNSIPSVATAFDIAIKGGGPGFFRLRINSTNTVTYAEDGSFVHVVWYLNASGITQSYIGPDGGSHTLDDGSSSLWGGTTLLIGNEPRNPNFGSTNLTDLYFHSTTGQPAVFEFDNLTISDSL
ncbi:hypothetical protein [Rubellicoccus peritrichatus]|uniref:PKD domain-containing protein n=1 Tax=Rubellicoccus peritrichatus TaxID=3080537 RepID=A0AAQ3L6C4_9BACT|nr:hypothetical protein [Puniceicoccus sp. CR14]WOO40319.1 hypothetical protein RZN69_17000 [Puniceicoccus sp. CR14]